MFVNSIKDCYALLQTKCTFPHYFIIHNLVVGSLPTLACYRAQNRNEVESWKTR